MLRVFIFVLFFFFLCCDSSPIEFEGDRSEGAPISRRSNHDRSRSSVVQRRNAAM